MDLQLNPVKKRAFPQPESFWSR